MENGIKLVPSVKSTNYTVINGNYSASVVFSDNSVHSVKFNVLSPDEAITELGDLLASSVTGK